MRMARGVGCGMCSKEGTDVNEFVPSSTEGEPAWQPQFLTEPIRGLPGLGVCVDS